MKHFRALPIVASLLALALTAAACGSGSESDGTVVASINGRELTRGQLDDLLPDGDNTVPTRIASTVSTWLLSQALEFELADRGWEPTDKEVEDSRDLVALRDIARNGTEEDLLTNAYALSLTVGRWSDAEAESLDDPEPPNYLCANHILVETEEDAQAALDRYNAGEDFAELAMELSTGPSAPDGGDLGCVPEGQFVEPFEEAAYAGEAGEVVGPVETAFGWHIIEIESVGPATIEVHPTANAAELEQLLAQARQEQIANLVTDLEAASATNYGGDAWVDPSIGTLDPETLEVEAG